MRLTRPPPKEHLVLALPAPWKFAVLALRAGGDAEVCEQQSEQKLKPRWRGRAKRELSPLSAALHRANTRMPEMWDPIPSGSGSRRDRKAASALLVFSHHVLLLEKTLEEMAAGVRRNC
jgi:hypothetical protein